MTAPRQPSTTGSPDAVADFLAALDDPRREALAALCDTIREVDPRIQGEIKWNAPSFLIIEHFATTGLDRGDGLRLVLHMGAKKQAGPVSLAIEDPGGLLDWKSPDRAIVTFADHADVVARREPLQSILRQWIDQTQ